MISKITTDEWFDNFRRLQKNYDILCHDTFDVRNKAQKSRDECLIESEWSMRCNNNALNNRCDELNEYKNLINNCVSTLREESKLITEEKLISEQHIEQIVQHLSLLSQCLIIREERSRNNLCLDNVELELIKEQKLLQTIKNQISANCDDAWQKILRIQKLTDGFSINASYKNEAEQTERETLNLDKYTPSVSHKLDTYLDLNYVSYNAWKEDFKNILKLTEEELVESRKLRNSMCLPRAKSYNEIVAQIEATNFSLRKRIHEFHCVIAELQWQKNNLERSIERLTKDIAELEEAKREERKMLKLTESKCANRVYRTGIELCRDNCTEILENHVQQMNYSIDRLTEKISATKGIVNTTEKQISLLEHDISDKTNAVTLDIRCLELRSALQPPTHL